MPAYPYLHFQGTCAEAMTFYAGVFGAADLQMMRYSEAPPEEGAAVDRAKASSDRIMHSQFTGSGLTIMASDFPAGIGDPQKAVSVMAAVKGAKGIFEKLLPGAEVIAPFGPTFWSPGFGMLKDRFGTHWIVAELTEEAPSN